MWYFNVAGLVFFYWLSLFLLDQETPKNHWLSWVVLIIASLCWPVSVPRAMIELANKAKLKQKSNNPEKNHNIIL